MIKNFETTKKDGILEEQMKKSQIRSGNNIKMCMNSILVLRNSKPTRTKLKFIKKTTVVS